MKVTMKTFLMSVLVVGMLAPDVALAAPFDQGLATLLPSPPSTTQSFGGGQITEVAGKPRRQVKAHRKTTRRTTVNRNRKVTVRRNTNVNVNVRRPVRVWVRRPYYGRVVAGVALGTIIVVAANSVPASPSSELCWYWSNSSKTRGYWDYCVIP